MINKKIMPLLGLLMFLITINSVKALTECVPLANNPYPCIHYTDETSCNSAGCTWSDNICSGTPHPCSYYNSETQCEAHGCVMAMVSTTIPKFCTDSDGGKNYYVKGTTKIYAFEYEDYCGEKQSVPIDTSTPTTTTPATSTSILTEFYCDENNISRYIKYDCPNGCKGGVCVNISTSSKTSNIAVRIYQSILNFFKTLLGKWYKVFD